MTPTLKSEKIHKRPSHETFMKSGKFIDPFVALINHSCEENAYCVLEGNQLRVRAARDIACGQEILFSYLGHDGDYDDRQNKLIQSWGIICSCAFCMKGKRGYSKAIKAKIGDLDDKKNKCKVVTPERALQYLERTIRIMEKSKNNIIGSPLIHYAYQRLVDVHYRLGDYEKALKAALKIRYIIEPAQEPTLLPYNRLGSLFNIILLMQSPIQAKAVLDVSNSVLVHLRVMYVKNVIKCFGSDSMVAKYESGALSRFAMEHAKKNGGKKYVPLATNEGEKEMFVSSMNLLLEWAGLESLTEEQLLR
jgi:tetratricopeptide (TPR) repeat protein